MKAARRVRFEVRGLGGATAATFYFDDSVPYGKALPKTYSRRASRWPQRRELAGLVLVTDGRTVQQGRFGTTQTGLAFAQGFRARW
jgi:hypothetical protein